MSETKIKFIANYMDTLNILSNKIKSYRKEYLDLELLVHTMPDCPERESLINTVISMRLKELDMELNMQNNLASLAKVMSNAEEFYILSEDSEFNKLEKSECAKMKAYFEMEKRPEKKQEQ